MGNFFSPFFSSFSLHFLQNRISIKNAFAAIPLEKIFSLFCVHIHTHTYEFIFRGTAFNVFWDLLKWIFFLLFPFFGIFVAWMWNNIRDMNVGNLFLLSFIIKVKKYPLQKMREVEWGWMAERKARNLWFYYLYCKPFCAFLIRFEFRMDMFKLGSHKRGTFCQKHNMMDTFRQADLLRV